MLANDQPLLMGIIRELQARSDEFRGGPNAAKVKMSGTRRKQKDTLVRAVPASFAATEAPCQELAKGEPEIQ